MSSKVSNSITSGEQVFLTETDWLGLLARRRNVGVMDRMLFEILKPLAAMPELLKRVQNYRLGTCNFASAFGSVQAIARQLRTLEEPIRIKLADKSEVKLTKAEDPRSQVPDVYEFNGIELPRICSYHAMLSIIVNNILMYLDDGRSVQWVHELTQRNLELSRRVWRMHQQAQNLGILWFYCYGTTLVVSYESAQSDEGKRWIVDLLNELHGRNPETDEMWDEDQVLSRCLLLSGRLSPEEVENIFAGDVQR